LDFGGKFIFCEFHVGAKVGKYSLTSRAHRLLAPPAF
jgi:hypothetical protein